MTGSRVLRFATCMCYLAAAVWGSTQTVVLPPISLASTETAEISVTSLAAEYPGWGFAGNCQVAVTFYGPDGSVLVPAAAFSVANGGNVLSAELPYPSAGAKVSSVSISAHIALTPAPYTYDGSVPPIPDCAVAYSLETYDTALGVGHTLLVGQVGQGTAVANIVGAVSVLPCLSPGDDCEHIYEHEPIPSQFISLPAIGLSSSEAAEIDLISSASNYSVPLAAVCNGSITFYGADGHSIGIPSNFVVGQTGQIFSATLAYASTGANGPRTVVSAQIVLTAFPVTVSYPASAVLPCAAAFSLKTFDTATGVTHIYAPGQTLQSGANAATGASASAPLRRRSPLR